MECKDVEYVDIVCGLAWGDEAKGKIVADLVKTREYDWVCRWNGGSNAGHTVYVNKEKYNTNIIPSGIFHNIPCFIGPDCYINIEDLEKELQYLKDSGFNTNLIKISPKAHIVTDEHIKIDTGYHNVVQGSTKKGIAPCAGSKFQRTGLQIRCFLNNTDYDIEFKIFDPNIHILKENEYITGKLLCEGAQGFWLDINYGSYPYVTSAYTLPYSACSLGFLPRHIRRIYGASKIYDTRVGVDPEFDKTIQNSEDSKIIAIEGCEYGTTTGRLRKANWLNMDKLETAIQLSGCTHLVISKVDILDKINTYRTLDKQFYSMKELQDYIKYRLITNCIYLEEIIFSSNPYSVL
jgi:adenylosuccinate synthase